MKKLHILGATFTLILGLFLFPHSILAATPTLSLTSFNNNSVQIAVNGDINSSVNLYYTPAGSSGVTSVGNIGSTNSNGYFSTTFYNSTYNIPSGSNAYVTVNGQQSNTVQWPYNNNNNNGSITFSQNNVSLTNGQSMTVTIYGGSGSYYISSNSNSNYVNATISGNQLYLSQPSGQYVGGSATIVVCSNNNNSSCGSLYVSQNGNNNNNGSISFSQNNVNLNIGQGQQITLYGSGNYYISYNSNSNAVSTNLNGNTLNLYGNQNGSATITVCSSIGSSNCSSLYVNVNQNGSSNNNGCYYSNGYYNCPNSNPVVYTQTPTSYQSPYGTPSAGVFLNQVPATGIKLNLKIALFFIGLFLWSAFGASMILSHRKYQKLLSEKARF